MIDVSELKSGRFPLLARLDDEDLQAFAERLERNALSAGTSIVAQGDEGHDLFLLLEGEARLSRNNVDLGALGPGSHFGEIALLGGKGRAATVRAETAVVVARLRREPYQALLVSRPQAALHLLEGLAQRLAAELVAMTDSVELLYDRRGLPHHGSCQLEIAGEAAARVTTVDAGTPLMDVLPAEIDGAPVVACLLGRRPVSMKTPVLADGRVEPITLRTWEGREVWRRSAGLLFLAASRRAAPDVSFGAAHSVSVGRVIRCVHGVGTPELARRIEAEMERLAIAATPIVREQWAVEEARRHFLADGEVDAAAALATERGATTSVLGLDGTYVTAMGPALPDVALLRGLRLEPHPEGLLLVYGDVLARYVDGGLRQVESELLHPRFASPMARDHERWLASLGVTSVGAFNDLCITGGVRELIRVSEGFHEKHIGRIADAIAARGEEVKVIAIAGPSSSGKTTFIKRLVVQLEVNGVHPKALSLDDYYVDRVRCPRDEKGDYDFEVLEALDTGVLQEQLRGLLRGDLVQTAHFDFQSGTSSPRGGAAMQLTSKDVLLIEGIHGLNPALIGGAVPRGQIFNIFVQPSSCLRFDALTAVMPSDVRFLRRIVRDRHARGTKAADNILRWASVRRGETRHIFPNQRHADAEFDTSLGYEMAVLKVYGERYLLEVPADHPASATAFRLRQLLDRFVAIYPDHVPPTSMLREFIGGSGFEY